MTDRGKQYVLGSVVERKIKESGLIPPESTVVVGVSGGADSVCLLHALYGLRDALKLRLIAAHLNHQIRREAAVRDAEFVEDLAELLGIDFVQGSSNVPLRARRQGLSLEMAARNARYRFFARVAKRQGADMVATAHTADDQAETLLLRLARGAGRGGLSGIARATQLEGVQVVRPMLRVNREEVERHLRARNLSWREDASNRDVAFLRNRVRHRVLPVFARELNPSLREALCRAAHLLSDEEKWLRNATVEALATCQAGDTAPEALSVPSLAPHPIALQRRIVREWLEQRDVPRTELDHAAVERILKMCDSDRGTAHAPLAGQWEVVREYNILKLRDGAREPFAARAFNRRLSAPGETLIAETGVRIVVERRPGLVRQKPLAAGRLPAVATLSAETVGRRQLRVRSWQAGDRVRPLNFEGHRKLQDIFVDAQLPASQRGRVPLVECGGEIVWVPGYCVAQGWEVQNAKKDGLQLRAEWI